jgi:hypothetical protein
MSRINIQRAGPASTLALSVCSFTAQFSYRITDNTPLVARVPAI